MANNTTTFTNATSNSPTRSKRVPHSFQHHYRPAAAPRTMMMMATNRKRKEVVEPSSYKPQLSLLRDRDKLLLPRHHPTPALEQGRGLTVLPRKCRKEFRHQSKSIGNRSSSRPTCCSISSLLSTAREEEKTNGYSNSANNCPMTLLKYFSPCAPFFFLLRLLPETACPCLLPTPRQYNFWTCNNPNGYTYNDKSSNNKLCKDIITKGIRATEASFSSSCNINKKNNNKKMSSILISVFMCFVLVGHIIQVGHASPISSVIAPTQTTTTTTTTTTMDMEYSGNIDNVEMKYFDRPHKRRLSSANQADPQEDDEYRFQQHHQLFMINNSTFDGGGASDDDDDDGVKEMNDETNGIDVNITKGHSRGRNLYSSTRSKNSSRNGSGNQLEFASLPSTARELTNNSNSRNKNMELWNKNEKKVLTTMPLAVKKRTEVVVAPSSPAKVAAAVASTSKQRQVTSAQEVTNDLSQEMKESGGSSGENNGDDESSFILINNNNNDNNNEDSSDSIIKVAATTSTTTLGKCWTMFVADDSEEMGKTKSSVYSFSLPLLSSPDSADPLFISTPAATATTTSVIGLMCNGTNHLEITLSQIPENLVNQVISIVVKDSLINTLNLSLFHRFPRLENISVTHSNISQIVGTCPVGLKALNISFNHIRKLNGSIFFMSGGSPQGYEDEYDDDASLGEYLEDNLEESSSNNYSDNIATNFSTEMISSFFASSAKQVLQEQKNKSDSMLELLSLSPSPSSSSEPSSTKKIRDNTKYKTDHYSKKLMRTTPLVQSRTKNPSPTPFSTNGEKQKDLEENIGPSLPTILNDDHRQLFQVRLLKKASSEPRMGASLETAETNESNAGDDDDSEDDDEGNGDGDDNLDVVSKKDNDSVTNKNEDKNAATTGRRATPTAAGVDFSAVNKEANIDCAINKYGLCKSGKFVRRSRQVTREVNERFDDYGNEQPQKHTNNAEKRRSGGGALGSSSGDLKNDSNLYGPPGNVVGERQAYYYHRNPRSSVLSATKGTAISIVNNLENGINVRSTKPRPTLFPKEKRFSNRSSTSTTKRKRKARTSITTTSSTPAGLSLEDIDLSHNKISELPRALLQLKGLKSLHLSGNQLKCDFVWEKLADWYRKSEDSTILKDGDDTFCGVVDDARVFQFTVLGVLKAKKDLVETCRTVDKNICHECGLYSLNKQPGHGYNLSHQSAHGNVAIALKLDCSFRNLSDLPAVPPQTWQLNVSGNAIKDLIPLKEPMYENLLILDADSNEISTLDGLTGTTFLDRYNVLSLQNNRFAVIPSNILSSLKNMRGQGVTFLGANFIDCDCDVVKDIKPLLLENSKQIRDSKEIYCKEMKARTGESYMAVKDLQYTDLCYLDSEESNEMYLYLVIFVELLLIFVIVGKVWHDQRTFRRTGILPFFSSCMPRLPCDAMLESVKEPPHYNRSSSTNVRSYACEPPATQSISSCVQLRDVRSNSGQSEKSSQISQLSSFPCSSRTSSV